MSSRGPVEHGEPVDQAAQAGAARDGRAALAVVGDDHDDLAAAAADVHGSRCGSRRSVTTLVSASAITKYAAASTGAGSSSSRSTGVDVQRRAGHERVDGGADAALGEERRMDAAGELTQLGQRDRELLADLVDRAGEPAVAQPRLQHPQVQGERDELLLGAVVEVALDPPARVVGGLDDPQPRDAQLLHAGAQLGLQALVVDRQPRGGAAAVTSSGEASSSASWTIAATRTPSWSTAVQVRPEPGSGSSTGRPRRRRRSRARAASSDVQRAVAEPLGEHLAHRPCSAARGRSSRGASSRSPRRRPRSAAMVTIVRRQREQHSTSPGAGRAPRPDEPAVVPASPLTPRPTRMTASSAGAPADRARAARSAA